MLLFTLFYLILAIVLKPGNISKKFFIQLSSLSLIYAVVLSVSTFNIHAVGYGLSIYSGFFQITIISQFFDSFLFLLGALAMLPWPLKEYLPRFISPLSIRGKWLSESQNLEGNVLPYNFSSPIKEFSLFLLFTTIGGSLLMSSSDLISVYLCIELQSFSVYLYSALYREKESSISAALKYYLLGSLSSCFILLGSVLIYSYTGLTQFDAIFSFISVTGDQLLFISHIFDFYLNILSFLSFEQTFFSSFAINIGIVLGIVLLLCGFFFKISAAPFHNWAPDVYDGTPTIITTWLTIIPKLTIFIFLLEFISGINISADALYLSSYEYVMTNIYPVLLHHSDVIDFFTVSYLLKSSIVTSFFGNSISSLNVVQDVILISSLLSLIIGTIVGLSQVRIKRLLTFSTISHVGFLLLVLSLNTDNSVQSFIFYIFQYSLTNLNVFFILLSFGYVYYQQNMLKIKNTHFVTDIIYIEDLKGYLLKYPLLSLSFAICLFSMAGTPPLVGFFAKQQVLFSTIYSGFYFLSFIAILVSVVSASYYLKIIRVLCFSSYDSNYASITYKNLNILNKELEESHPNEKIFVIRKISDLTPILIISNYHSFIISSLTLFILFFIFKSSFILNSAYLLAESTVFL